jgi:hypothetical protein
VTAERDTLPDNADDLARGLIALNAQFPGLDADLLVAGGCPGMCSPAFTGGSKASSKA